MITFQNADLKFGTISALNKCSLQINDAEQVAIIGPSGSGKSSLLKTITSENILTAGSLKINGEETSQLSPKALKAVRRSIAYIPQDLALIPNIKVTQNISLGSVGREHTFTTLKNLVFPSKSRQEEIFSILKELGIPEKMFLRTDSLSGGQQQRVAIARAIFQKAQFLLADEPVSAVDPTRAHDLLDCITTTAREHKMTLLCTLHNIEYAKIFFPRLIGMRAGKVVYDGPSSEFSETEFNNLYKLKYEYERK